MKINNKIRTISIKIYNNEIFRLFGEFLLKNLIAFSIPACMIWLAFSTRVPDNGSGGVDGILLLIFFYPIFILSLMYLIWSTFKLYFKLFSLCRIASINGERVEKILKIILTILTSIIYVVVLKLL